MSEPVVQVTDLVERYGEIEAWRGVTFAVTAGETFCFPGPNGAGKPATIKSPVHPREPLLGVREGRGH